MFNTFFTQFYSISHKDITVEKKLLGFIYNVMAIFKTDLFCARFYFCDFVMQPVCLFVCLFLVFVVVIVFFAHARGMNTTARRDQYDVVFYTIYRRHCPSFAVLTASVRSVMSLSMMR